MRYTLTYESFFKSLKGGILLASLLGIPNISSGQINKSNIESKAKLAVIDDEVLTNTLDSLEEKGYNVYGRDVDLSGQQFLFSSSSDLKLNKALEEAKADANVKMKYLGVPGKQLILSNNAGGF